MKNRSNQKSPLGETVNDHKKHPRQALLMTLASKSRISKEPKLFKIFDIFYGEFDPGSGRTLAACLTHASRTEYKMKLAIFILSGGRVSNAWITCLIDRDNSWKRLLIPDTLNRPHGWLRKAFVLSDGSASH